MKEIKIGRLVIPLKCLLMGVGAISFNFTVYFLARTIAGDLPKASLALPLDEKIPFVPATVLIYWGCYLFWAVNYICGMMYDKGHGYRFILAHVLADMICFFFFIFLPTSMERPEPTGDSLMMALVRLTYLCDEPNNLFPSIHCFASWLCWIGVRKNAHVPRGYRYASLAMALAVCVSTVTMKQHVLADVPAGILVAELSYVLAGWLEDKSFARRKCERNP